MEDCFFDFGGGDGETACMVEEFIPCLFIQRTLSLDSHWRGNLNQHMSLE